jgi:naringenin 3-dioxygenase
MAQVSSGVPFLPTAASGDATLRASFVRDEDERPKVPHDRFRDEVPVVSLEGIDDGGGARRAEIRDRVAAACEDWGIFQVVDHGVDAALVAEMARLARDFFALPAEDKLRFDMSGGKKGGFIVSSHLQVYICVYVRACCRPDGWMRDQGHSSMYILHFCRERWCRTGVRS